LVKKGEGFTKTQEITLVKKGEGFQNMISKSFKKQKKKLCCVTWHLRRYQDIPIYLYTPLKRQVTQHSFFFGF
jgi:hypothetical protein